MNKHIILGIALVATGASASTSVTYLGTGRGQNLQVNVTETLRDAMGLSNVETDVFAGELRWDLTNLGYGSNEKLVCTELTQQISGGTTYDDYSIRELEDAPIPAIPHSVGSDSAMAIARLFEHGYALVTNNATAAAFQAAVWDVFYDGRDGLGWNTGSMTFAKRNGSALDSSFTNAFDTFAAIMRNDALAVSGYVFAISSPTAQDQVVYDPTGRPPALIPLPSAGLLAAAGLGLVARRRVR